MVSSLSHFDRNFGFIINDISRLARKEFDRRVRGLHLTRAQWLFLYHLARLPDCTQSELAERLQMERITISRQAGRLETAGWIQRHEDRRDGRAYRLRLTPKAERLTRQLEVLAGQLRDEYLGGLSPARRDALVDDLILIKSNLLRLEAKAKRRSDDEN